jgi:hypothetical protein
MDVGAFANGSERDMTEQDRQLDEWLAEMAEADREVSPPDDLETRVMARVRLQQTRGPWTSARARRRVVRSIAACAAIAAAVTFYLLLERPRVAATPIEGFAPAVVSIAAEAAAVPTPAPPVASIETPTRRAPAARTPPRRTSADPGREVLDFVPLVPLSEEELRGAFQIVRVQLSRGPGGPVQADVLLGQDGMARAIRVVSHR